MSDKYWLREQAMQKEDEAKDRAKYGLVDAAKRLQDQAKQLRERADKLTA